MRRHTSSRVSGVLAAVISTSSVAATPLPDVSSPLTTTPESHAFGAAQFTRNPQDLGQLGYVEEEMLVSGEANVYDWPEAGVPRVRTAAVPYTTRVLLRRPARAKDFSGTVIVELLNPSNLFDLNIGWAISHRQIVRSGDAWIGITAKPISVVSLKAFDPQRYALLNWANPLSTDDPANCTPTRPDTTRDNENGLVWDIHSQVAAWLRSQQASNPLTYGRKKSPVQRLYAWGYSQSGSFLYTYINAIHALDVKANGRPLFDAYLVAVSGGPAPINQCAPAVPPGDPRRQFKDVGVPIIRIMTQSDYLNTIAARQPDSDQSPHLFRNYEVAGAGHATPEELFFAAQPADIIKAGRAVPPLECNEGPRSRFPNHIAFDAALANLDRWIRTGRAPPRAAPIEVVDGRPVLDAHGNVKGGVRSPLVDVPTSTWNGNSTGESFCRIAGHEIPFDAAKLKQLYPSHRDYANAVRSNVEQLVREGFITQEDGKELIARASRSLL